MLSLFVVVVVVVDESVTYQEDPVASLVYKSCMYVMSFVRACSDFSFYVCFPENAAYQNDQCGRLSVYRSCMADR